MQVVNFSIEEKTSKKGKVYYVLVCHTKDGEKFIFDFVRKYE